MRITDRRLAGAPRIDKEKWAITRLPRRGGSTPAKYLPVSGYGIMSPHNFDSQSGYFVASQDTFKSPSTDLNSGSPVSSSAFLILARAAAKQSA